MGIGEPSLLHATAADPDCAVTRLIATWPGDRIRLCSRTRRLIAANHPLDRTVRAWTGTFAHKGRLHDAFLPALRGTAQGRGRIIHA